LERALRRFCEERTHLGLKNSWLFFHLCGFAGLYTHVPLYTKATFFFQAVGECIIWHQVIQRDCSSQNGRREKTLRTCTLISFLMWFPNCIRRQTFPELKAWLCQKVICTRGYATVSFPGDLSPASLEVNQLPLSSAESASYNAVEMQFMGKM